MDLPGKFSTNWKENFAQLSPQGCHLLLAVSGGLDSIVLTDLVAYADFRFTIAHCNFGLRGEESDRDEAFVRQLAARYKAEIVSTRFDTNAYAEKNKTGIQEAARDLRYEWFETQRAALQIKHNLPTYIVTAHHADDNIETVLFNIFRGTGIEGLHGILLQQGHVIRPLLFATREEILAYAKEQQLEWVEDSSNASTKYTRNYIRHEVLPLVKQVFPTVMQNLGGSIERWRECGVLYRQAVEKVKSGLCEVLGNEVHIPVLKLKKSSPLKTIVFEIIKDYGFSAAQTDEVVALLESSSGKYVASASYRVLRNRNWLIIAPNQTEASNHILIEAGAQRVDCPFGTIEVEQTADCPLPTADFQGPTVNTIATLDASHITFPLLLRRWKQGDYFYPLGMRKKKKLSRFLIDNKVSVIDKENTWVIESDKRIIWVVGRRIDDRFKIIPSTKQVLRLSITNR